ncbi:RnfABCDGE type electron transport complex subunit D, partial [Gilvimarinus sp. 1_MG-2023]
FSPPNVTNNTAHVRDGIDLKRIMITVWVCTFPAMLFGMYNIGLQANEAMAAGAGTVIEGWREFLIVLLGGGAHDAASFWDNFVFGAAYFLPVYATVFI